MKTIALLRAALLLAASVGLPVLAESAGKRPLTVTDAIEYRRALSGLGEEFIVASPDGDRFVAALQHGDVARNGSWVELISGETTSLDAASKVKIVAKLFTKSKVVVWNLLRDLHWLDERHVAFIWDDGEGPPQAVAVDLVTGGVQHLTHHSTEVVRFDVSSNGGTMIYRARRARDASSLADPRTDGIVVSEQGLRDLLTGNHDGWDPLANYETFITDSSSPVPRRVTGNERVRGVAYVLRIAPNGRLAASDEPALEFPMDWDKYTDRIFSQIALPVVRKNPNSRSAISQFWIIDLEHARARPLWQPPRQSWANVVWSPDSGSVIVGPTFLPTEDANASGLKGIAVAEVDVATGRYSLLPLPTDRPAHYGYRPVSWDKNGMVEVADVQDRSFRVRFKKVEGEWRQVREMAPKPLDSRVRIELRQDIDIPPALYAVEVRSGRERMILDLNPRLRSELALGRVERIHWKDREGAAWTGVLYYPVNYSPGRRFPLVLQPNGFNKGEFTLDGRYTTAYAAQPLANRDIAVLLLRFPDDAATIPGLVASPLEVDTVMAGCESAIEHLVASGLVDRERVGLVGFSRAGWYVEHMLTHSLFPFRAAITSDNVTASYGQYMLWDTDAVRGELEKDVGAVPVGAGLQTWLTRAPGFNADKVHAPLRAESASNNAWIAAVLSRWELFSNLRYLKKPVEMVVLPDIEHAGHPLQNPAQRLASQGGTVDWFDFWLNGREDPDPLKAGQYQRWRKLKALQDKAVDK